MHRACTGIDTPLPHPFDERLALTLASATAKAAAIFARRARSGRSRIVYLGGLGRQADLSHHLRSRAEVGNVLRESARPVVEFSRAYDRSGSISFEMMRQPSGLRFMIALAG